MKGAAARLEPSVWRALDHHFADALFAIRTTPPFESISPAEWSVFSTQLTSWARGDDELTQPDLAALTGLSVRTIRRLATRLEEVGILATEAVVGVAAGYRPGPVFADFLREYARGRDPHIWVREGGRLPATTPDIHDPAPAPVSPMTAGPSPTPDIHDTPRPVDPARVSTLFAGNLERLRAPAPTGVAHVRGLPEDEDPFSLKSLKKININSSLSAEKGPTPDTVTTPATPTPANSTPSAARLDRDGIRAAAIRALTARYVFGRPEKTPPATFAEADIETLLRVTAHCRWTEAELDQVHRDAILGASLHSRTSPPTVGYIWGKQDYFDRNVQKGREKRRESEPVVKRPKKPKPPDEPPATLEELVAIGRRGMAILEGPSPYDVKRNVNRRFFQETNP